MSPAHSCTRAAARVAPLAVLVLAVLCQQHPARANGPGVSLEGGTICPINSTVIRLVSETVDIHLERDVSPATPGPPANATCVYRLQNLTGTTQRFLMAFVTKAGSVPDSPEAWSDLYLRTNFRVWQDGTPRPVRYYPPRRGSFPDAQAAGADSLPTWELVIAPRRTSTVRMSYVTDWVEGCDGVSCGRAFTYYASPAARWAGRIERAVFRLHLGDSEVVSHLRRTQASWRVEVSPPTGEWTADGLCWEFSDWKPDTDLRFDVSYPGSDEEDDPSWDPWTPDSIARTPEVTKDLDRAPEAESATECGAGSIGAPRGGWPADSTTVRVHITASGEVDGIRYPGFSETFRRWVGPCIVHWRFRPALKGGQAVPAWTDVTVRFATSH